MIQQVLDCDVLQARVRLLASEPVFLKMQSRVRGLLARQEYAKRRDHIEANVAKIVKIQSLYRAKLAENAYRQLSK